MNQNTIFKEAVVLLITAMFVFTSLAVTADTNKQQDTSALLGLATEIDIPSSTVPSAFMLDYLHYDDGTNVNALGLINGGTFEWGIRLTPTELSGYDGYYLTTVRFHHGFVNNPQPTHSGNVYVYEAGTTTTPGAQITTATTPWTHTGSDWLDVALTTPVVIDETQDLWVTVDVTHLAGEYPAGCGPGPMVRDKGGFISTGGDWIQIADIYFDYNWNVWAGVEETLPPAGDLECDGELAWTKVKPGSTVEGSFEVSNGGEAGSTINWEISDVPNFGTNWTFDPDGGTGLTPEDGAVTVSVSVEAPTDEETEFSGNITIVNSADPADTCTISVSLVTPVSQSQPTLFMQFISWLFEQFPLLALIFG